jgi:hypothetical protein
MSRRRPIHTTTTRRRPRPAPPTIKGAARRPAHPEAELLSIEQSAPVAGLTASGVREYLAPNPADEKRGGQVRRPDGWIPWVRLGRYIRIPRRALLDAIAKRTTKVSA